MVGHWLIFTYKTLEYVWTPVARYLIQLSIYPLLSMKNPSQKSKSTLKYNNKIEKGNVWNNFKINTV